MGILNLKKNKAVATEISKKTKKLTVVSETKTPTVIHGLAHVDAGCVLVRPRVTEKATALSEKQGRQVCVFEVTPKANSRNVTMAVAALYKVVPVKVAILRIPRKKSFVKGKVSYGKTGYKAYVYFKKGENIEIV